MEYTGPALHEEEGRSIKVWHDMKFRHPRHSSCSFNLVSAVEFSHVVSHLLHSSNGLSNLFPLPQ